MDLVLSLLVRRRVVAADLAAITFQRGAIVTLCTNDLHDALLGSLAPCLFGVEPVRLLLLVGILGAKRSLRVAIIGVLLQARAFGLDGLRVLLPNRWLLRFGAGDSAQDGHLSLWEILRRHQQLVLLVLLLVQYVLAAAGLEPADEAALLPLLALLILTLIVPQIVVLVEHEELELEVQVARQLDLGREDVHLDLVVDAPGRLGDDDEAVFESAFDHRRPAVYVLDRLVVCSIIVGAEDHAIVLAVEQVLDGDAVDVQVLLRFSIGVYLALAPDALDIQRRKLLILVKQLQLPIVYRVLDQLGDVGLDLVRLLLVLVLQLAVDDVADQLSLHAIHLLPPSLLNLNHFGCLLTARHHYLVDDVIEVPPLRAVE